MTQPGSPKQRRVLVVDDEPTIAASVAARLRAEGFVVDIAHDGPSAMASVAADEPDLVVLDVMLPGFDGLEVCRRIHARRPIPVLMLTARDAETDLLVGLAVGADDYLTKPFSIRELAARCTRCCAASTGPPRRAPGSCWAIWRSTPPSGGSPAAASPRT